MILRNPAFLRDSFLYRMCIAYVMLTLCQSPNAQGIEGIVLPSQFQTGHPNAIITVWQGEQMLFQVNTNEQGRYQIKTDIAGRVRVRAEAPGIFGTDEQMVLLDGYTMHALTHILQGASIDLQDVVVTSTRTTEVPYVQTITQDDVSRVAGNYSDPLRVAHSLPGVILVNDQANHFSARGQSPLYNNYFLEGLQIVNPNHTNNAGTPNDRPTISGGGINLFSSQILGSTDIYTGITPIHSRHTPGAAIDMHLHETTKPEWRAKAGLLGFEAGGGTGNPDRSILDINLRYSFTGLLTDLGADFGGERIGYYDGVVSYCHKSPKHKLKVFGFAGSSYNYFDRVEPETDRESFKEFFDIDYDNDIAGAGFRMDLFGKSNRAFRTGFAISTNKSEYSRNGSFEDLVINEQEDVRQSLISAFMETSIRHGDRVLSKVSLGFTERRYEEDGNLYSPFVEESQLRLPVQTSILLFKNWEWMVGGDLTYSILWEQFNIGYTSTLRIPLGRATKVYLGVRDGVHEPVDELVSSNRNNIAKATVLEIGGNTFWKNQSFGLRFFYENMQRVRGRAFTEYFFPPDYPFPPVETPISVRVYAGNRQYGGELDWSWQPKSGYSIQFNQAVFRSDYTFAGVPVGRARYDAGFATHLLVSKEWLRPQRDDRNRIWNVSMRGIVNGGLREARINVAWSEQFSQSVTSASRGLSEILPAFVRADLSISRTIANAKVKWRYSLDIQNLAGIENEAYQYYDTFLNSIETQYHLGIIPVLSVQASW